MKNKVSTLPTVVDAIANQLAVSEVKNFNKWQIIGHQSYLEVYVGTSYQDEVRYLKAFLTDHIAWLDQKFNSADYQ